MEPSPPQPSFLPPQTKKTIGETRRLLTASLRWNHVHHDAVIQGTSTSRTLTQTLSPSRTTEFTFLGLDRRDGLQIWG